MVEVTNEKPATIAAAFDLLRAGSLEEAVTTAGRLVDHAETACDAHFIQGLALMQLGRTQDGVWALGVAAKLECDAFDYAYTYGGALLQADEWLRALVVFHDIAEKNPGFKDVHYFEAVAALRAGRWPQAVRVLEQALQTRPDDPRVRGTLDQAYAERRAHRDILKNGQTAAAEGRSDDAFYWYDEMLAKNPSDLRALWLKAAALGEADRPDESIAAYKRFIAAGPPAPNIAAARFNIAWIYSQKLMDPVRSVASYRELLEGGCDEDAERSARHEILFYLPQISGTTAGDLRDEAVAFQQRFGSGLIPARQGHTNKVDPERKLRIGFVSRLFNRWSYSRQILPMLRHNDAEAFDIYCYQIAKEPIEPAIRAEKAHWREIQARPRAEMADVIAQDDIDILIDCNGASSGCGYEIFSRKPAPVQVGWSNKSMTTGSTAMDYFIADSVMLEGHDDYFTEKLYRMPCYYVPYAILDDAPPVTELPYDKNGVITFGTLATPCKFGSEGWQAWGRVLRAIPEARFFVKNANAIHGSFQSYIAESFAAVGVTRDRLIFSPGGPHHEFLRGYGEIDIALDTMPMPGGNTIVEALWQGVPTVSKHGPWFVSRSSLSIYSRVGLTNLVVSSEDEFVDLAVRVAQDKDGLRRLRSDLRPRLARSTIFDGENFAREFQAALRFMWREWCRRQKTGQMMRSGPLSGPSDPGN